MKLYQMEIRGNGYAHTMQIKHDEWHPFKLFETLEVEIEGKPTVIQITCLTHPILVDGRLQIGLLCTPIDRSRYVHRDTFDPHLR